MEEVELNLELTRNGSGNISDPFGEIVGGKYIFHLPLNAILICTYIPLFLIALISNILVILVVGRYRCLRSVTNYFIVNLSVADLLVTLICMPVAVGQSVTHLWIYGEVLCKLTHYLQGVAVSSSVFTITVMSIDRYLAIRHPMSRKIINRRTTRKVILCLWSLSLVIFSPILYIRKLRKVIFVRHMYEESFCVEAWPDNLSRKTFGAFCFVVVYAVPGFIVVLAYSLMGLRLCSRHLLPEYEQTHGMSSPNAASALSQFDTSNSTWQVSSAGGRLIRERRRVAKILLILALVFAMCWLPYSVISLVLDLKSEEDGIMDLAMSLLPFAILLGHVNSAVNPLLYCLLSKNFRRSVTELVRHPTRTFRNRQPHKMRMTFRKDPPEVKEKNSSSKDQVSNHRPRNHHAPDPAEESVSSLHAAERNTANRPIPTGPDPNKYFGDTIQLYVLDKKIQNNRELLLHSPCSSGYSSLRHSLDTLTLAAINKETTSLCQCSHYQSRNGGKNCHYCSNWNSSACLAEQTSGFNGRKNLGDGTTTSLGLNRLNLPASICEETSVSSPKHKPKMFFKDLQRRDSVVNINRCQCAVAVMD